MKKTNWIGVAALCGLCGMGTQVHAETDFRIGFVSDGSTVATQLQTLINQEVFTLLGSEVNVETTSYVGKPTPQSLNALANQAYADDSIDVVVTPGFLGSNFLFKNEHFAKPTILSQVVDPRNQENTPLDTRANLYWLSQRQDISQTLNAIRVTLNPKKITLLLAVDQAHLGAELIEGLIDQGERLGMTVEINQFDVGKTAFEQISATTELVLLPPLSHEQTTRVIQNLSQHHIPVFTFAGRRVVEQGALMTDISEADIAQIARRIALDIYSLYLKEPVPTGPRWLEMKHELILNLGVAVGLGVDLPIDVLSTATLVGESALSQQRIELEETIGWMRAKNPSLAQSELSVRIANEDVIQSHSALRPQINGNVKHERDDASGASAQGGDPTHDTQAALSLSQNLYSVNKSTNFETAKLAQAASQQTYSALELDLIQLAIDGYLDVLSAQTAVNTGVENLALSRDTLTLTNKRQRFGSGTPADVYTSEASIAVAESALLSARIRSFEVRRALMELSNTHFDENAQFGQVDISNALFSPTHALVLPLLKTIGGIRHLADVSSEYAKQVDPTLAANALTITSNALRFKAANKSRFSPEVDLSGQAFRILQSGGSNNGIDTQGVNDWSVALNINIPIWNSGNLASIARKASEQKTISELAHTATQNKLDTEVRNSVFKVAEAWRNIKLGRIELQSAEKSLEIDHSAYAGGAITITTLQSTQNTYISALEGVREDKYRYLSALLNWQRYMAAMPALMKKSQYKQWAGMFGERLGETR